MIRTASVAAIAGLALGTPVLAQNRYVFVDRTTNNHKLWLVDDLDSSLSIAETGANPELFQFWSSANAAGTPAMSFPACLAYRPSDGMLAVGDNTANGVFFMRDANRDWSAQGVAESAMVAGPASGLVFNPLGIAFDASGNVYVSNSGNGAGASDVIYKMTDVNGNGSFNDPGDITPFVGVPFFGAGNGDYVPAELVMDNSVSPPVGYWKDSGNVTGHVTNGVYRFSDADGSGRADDPGEVTTFIAAGNASGVAISAGGLTLALDAVRPNSVYFTQITPNRQLVRAQDLNNNKNAMDAGEAAVVWATAETATFIDVCSLPDGRVVLTDTTRRIIVLTPTGSTFNGYAGSPLPAGTGYTLLYTSSNQPAGNPPTPGSVRQIVAIPRACAANCDDSTSSPVLNVADFTCYLQKYASGDPYANCDGSTTQPVLNVADFTCFLQKYAGGCT